MTPATDANLGAKIKKEVEKEAQRQADKQALTDHVNRMSALVDRPSSGKSRLKAHRGQLTVRHAKARRLRTIAKASKSHNR